ncbi:MAG: permease [Desulfomonilaceae bacterium]
MNYGYLAIVSSWTIFKAASPYLLFGFIIAGIIRVYVNPNSITKYLQTGRFWSVFYASLSGIPIPLCSCGVVPAVAGLRKQGANKGACLAFLVSTPETVIDSIALIYSLLGPILTLMRPITAFVSGFCSGLIENFMGNSYGESRDMIVDKACVVDGCSDGIDCYTKVHARHHSRLERFWAGINFAFSNLMDDLAVWFVIGMALAGVISALIPAQLVSRQWGPG